jgi:hypothetical protein
MKKVTELKNVIADLTVKFDCNVRFKVFTAVTTKNGEEILFIRRVRRLLVTTSVVPSSQILVTLMK